VTIRLSLDQYTHDQILNKGVHCGGYVKKVCDDSFVIRSIYHDQIRKKGGHCGGYVKKVCDDSFVIRSIYHDQI